MSRGWYGIAIYEPKIEANLGVVCRSAHAFGAAFVACIGQRYRAMASDTTKAGRSLPILYFPSWREFSETCAQIPIVTMEVGQGHNLPDFHHPEQAIYVLGGEDRTLPVSGDCSVHIETKYCLNLGSCATVLMYDRHMKHMKRKEPSIGTGRDGTRASAMPGSCGC